MENKSLDFEHLDWTEPPSTVGLGEPLSDEDLDMAEVSGLFYKYIFVDILSD